MHKVHLDTFLQYLPGPWVPAPIFCHPVRLLIPWNILVAGYPHDEVRLLSFEGVDTFYYISLAARLITRDWLAARPRFPLLYAFV